MAGFVEYNDTGLLVLDAAPAGDAGQAIQANFQILGDHLAATADAHPIAAITGLADALDALSGGGDPTTGAANRFLATPDGSSGAVALRAIVPADVPTLATSKITGLDAALAAKAPLASPTFTGTPAGPTAGGGTNTTQLATTAFVRAEVAALVNAAPGTLDTLGEIADQLASDESTAAALATTVGGKLAKTSNLSDLANAGTARTNLGLATVAASGSAADLAGTLPVGHGGTGLTGVASGKLLYASATNTLAALSLGSGLSITSGVLDVVGGGGGPLDAAYIADGSVSDAEFQYLNGLTGNIQDQIDGLSGGGGGSITFAGLLASSGDAGGGYITNLASLTSAGNVSSGGTISAVHYCTDTEIGSDGTATFVSADGSLQQLVFAEGLYVRTDSAGGPSPAGCPTGSLMPFAGTVAPDGWLLCDGSAVSRSTYGDLFALVGEAYGAGDGSSTFNLPDFADRGPIGPGTYTVGTGIGDWAPAAATAADVAFGTDANVVTAFANNPPRSVVVSFIIKT